MTLDDKTNNHMYKVSENLSSCCIDRSCSLISAVSRSVYLIYVMFFLSYITGDCRILICCSFFIYLLVLCQLFRCLLIIPHITDLEIYMETSLVLLVIIR